MMKVLKVMYPILTIIITQEKVANSVYVAVLLVAKNKIRWGRKTVLVISSPGSN